jgi:hypothetical protein
MSSGENDLVNRVVSIKWECAHWRKLRSVVTLRVQNSLIAMRIVWPPIRNLAHVADLSAKNVLLFGGRDGAPDGCAALRLPAIPIRHAQSQNVTAAHAAKVGGCEDVAQTVSFHAERGPD